MYAFTFRKPTDVSTFRINWFKFFLAQSSTAALHSSSNTLYIFVCHFRKLQNGEVVSWVSASWGISLWPLPLFPPSKISRRIQKWAPIMILAPPQRNSPQTENAVDISARPTRDLIILLYPDVWSTYSTNPWVGGALLIVTDHIQGCLKFWPLN